MFKDLETKNHVIQKVTIKIEEVANEISLCLIIPFLFKHCENLKELNIITGQSKLDITNIESLI